MSEVVVVTRAYIDGHVESRERLSRFSVLIGEAVVGDVAGHDDHVRVVVCCDVGEHRIEGCIGVVCALTALGERIVFQEVGIGELDDTEW